MEGRVPKSEWAPGPWHDEPDRLEWRSPVGLPALIVRSDVTGGLCGYAGVPPEHPLYGLKYGDCGFHFKAVDCNRVPWRRHYRQMREGARSLWLRYGGPEPYGRGITGMLQRHDPDLRHAHTECYDHAPDSLLECHGGITYSGGCDGPICHTPAPGEPENVWWFGFDCGHAGDVTPAMDALLRNLGSRFRDQDRGDVYRDLAYVQAEANRLAAQLFVFKGRIYCQRCGRRRQLKQLHCRCGSKGAWRFA